MRDMANYTLAHSLDILGGRVGVREATASLTAIRETRRNVQVGVQIGERRQVLDPAGPAGAHDPLLARERELTAELEALRERRGA